MAMQYKEVSLPSLFPSTNSRSKISNGGRQSYFLHLSHRGRLHAPCKRETKSASVRIGPGAPFEIIAHHAKYKSRLYRFP